MSMHVGTPVGGSGHDFSTFSKDSKTIYGVKTFLSSGTLAPKVPIKVDVLCVAGGGGAGAGGTSSGGGGGAGAGGYIYQENKTLLPGE